jgi:hypothetical protein
MTAPKKILILYSDADMDAAGRDGVRALADSLSQLGAVVTMQACDGPYDAALDAVAAADSVLFWR